MVASDLQLSPGISQETWVSAAGGSPAEVEVEPTHPSHCIMVFLCMVIEAMVRTKPENEIVNLSAAN